MVWVGGCLLGRCRVHAGVPPRFFSAAPSGAISWPAGRRAADHRAAERWPLAAGPWDLRWAERGEAKAVGRAISSEAAGLS